jgi:hypothetical protein
MSDTRQTGGHKGNINNPNTSEESKQHSHEFHEDSHDAAQRSGKGSQEGKNPGNGMPTWTLFKLTRAVAGGYKATLKNPNASDDAKQRAEQQLKNM